MNKLRELTDNNLLLIRSASDNYCKANKLRLTVRNMK